MSEETAKKLQQSQKTIYWVSTKRMTFEVTVDEYHIITDSAPIGKKFIGQPLSNLVKWMKRQGGFRMEKQ